MIKQILTAALIAMTASTAFAADVDLNWSKAKYDVAKAVQTTHVTQAKVDGHNIHASTDHLNSVKVSKGDRGLAEQIIENASNKAVSSIKKKAQELGYNSVRNFKPNLDEISNIRIWITSHKHDKGGFNGLFTHKVTRYTLHFSARVDGVRDHDVYHVGPYDQTMHKGEALHRNIEGSFDFTSKADFGHVKTKPGDLAGLIKDIVKSQF